MPILNLDDIADELVTPKHSTALGKLITGTQIEIGILRYKAGEGAEMHQHPHEQVFIPLSGKIRFTIGDKVTDIGVGQAALIEPNIPHKLEILEDTEAVSAKGVVGGVGHRI